MRTNQSIQRSHKEILDNVKEELLDPLAIKLTSSVEWWNIKDDSIELSNEYPVVVIGEGNPILMLHGFDSCFLEFRRLVPYLINTHKVIIPDMFGFGFCPRPTNANYGKEAIINHLGYILRKLNKQEPIGVIGASMGGAVAMELARRYPSKINRILLLSPAGLTGKPQPLPHILAQVGVWILKQSYVRKGLCRQAFANPNSCVGPPEEQIASIHLQVPGWQDSLAAFARQGGIANCGLPLPSQRLEILWGKEDRILKGQVQKETYEILSSYIEELEDCGHLPHLDQPVIVAQTWLKEISKH